MENEKKTTLISYIITGVALIGIVILLLVAKKQQLNTTAAETQQQAQQASAPVSLCYLLNAPSKGGAGHDVAYLKITTSDGGMHVTGELGTAPAEKDKVSGTITGTISAGSDGSALLDAQYANAGEGMTSTNEQLIRLDETQAQIGYGEEVKSSDGSYHYKDANAVTYSMTLPAVDCTQYNTLKAAAWKY